MLSESEPSIFGWSRSRAFLVGAGAEHFCLESEPSIFGLSRSRAFLVGVGAEHFWLESEPSIFGWSRSSQNGLNNNIIILKKLKNYIFSPRIFCLVKFVSIAFP